MNKKGQVYGVLLGFMIVILTGIGLAVLSPVLDTLRKSIIANPETDLLMKLVMYAFMPLMWGIYLLLSIITIRRAVLTPDE